MPNAIKLSCHCEHRRCVAPERSEEVPLGCNPSPLSLRARKRVAIRNIHWETDSHGCCAASE